MTREAGLYLYHGNRLEDLAHILAGHMRTSPCAPLEAETILVQSKGMQKWLSLLLARELGICANLVFPFPNALMERFFACLPGEAATDTGFDREVMTLRLFGLLPSLLAKESLAPLRDYVGDDPGSLQAFQLISRIAYLFDQYATYRPEVLLAWEEGQGEGWQAELWQRLAGASPGLHRARRQRDFLRSQAKGQLEPDSLPQRISVFAVSTLPPLHLDALAAVAERCPVYFYLLNPSREYWFDLVSEKTRARMETDAGLGDSDLHCETRHPMLSSWGRTGSDFFSLLLAHDRLQEQPCFTPPPGDSLLHRLQNHILTCQEPDPTQELPVSSQDTSISIHSCHMPLREMEVLRDYLLSCFEAIPDLRASDILVMTPDIEVYAPYIEAVFHVPEDDPRYLPYAIADRSFRNANGLVQSFFEVLGLRTSRFEASRVMAILECPEVQQRFDLHGGDLDMVYSWLEATRIRWGLDAADREAQGLPALAENTWRAGLERLLLGYALPGDERRLFEGILPCPDVEGGSAVVLGRFLDFFQTLAEAVEFFRGSRPLAEWTDRLSAFLNTFYAPAAAGQPNFQALETALRQLAENAAFASCEIPVDMDVVEAALADILAGQVAMPGNFLSGKMTFCALLPMRSIPFKVIALVGINNGSFPRQTTPLSFDIMAEHPRRGDRSLRDEDKYLFLETLVSARERLFISYLGQDMRDNSEILPSILVTELMAELDTGFRPENRDEAVSSLIHTTHPLQGFDARYFDGRSSLFRYSKEKLEALQAGRAGGRAASSSELLPQPDDTWRNISLNQVLRFFRHPVRFFFQQRLGVFLEDRSVVLEDRDSFALGGLERYHLGHRLVASRLAGDAPHELFPPMKKAGDLPFGPAGDMAFQGLGHEAEKLAEKVKRNAGDSTEEVCELAGRLGDVHLNGKVGGIFGNTLIRYRFASLKPEDRLAAWLEMLALAVLSPDQAPERALVMGTNAAWTCNRPDNAAETLAELLALFERGLREPLLFFPGTSCIYVETLAGKNGGHDRALAKAKDVWQGTDYKKGEGADAYYELFPGETDPCTREDFVLLATRIFGPLLQAGGEG